MTYSYKKNRCFINTWKSRGSIQGGNGVKTELHVLRRGQPMGLPYLNDLTVDGPSNTSEMCPTFHEFTGVKYLYNIGWP